MKFKKRLPEAKCKITMHVEAPLKSFNYVNGLSFPIGINPQISYIYETFTSTFGSFSTSVEEFSIDPE